jgi:hypothetical protein
MNIELAELLAAEPAWKSGPRRTLHRAMSAHKTEVKRSDEDDPARAAYLDELRAKRNAPFDAADAGLGDAADDHLVAA